MSNQRGGGSIKHSRLIGLAAAFILAAAYAAVQSGRVEAAAVTWNAMSNTAMSITGDVSISPTDLTLAGADYALTHVASVPVSQRAAIGEVVAVSQPSAADLYRIKIPGARKLHNGNTLCGGKDAIWLLVVSSGPTLALAFFSGAAQPPLDGKALGNSAALCGTFTYGH